MQQRRQHVVEITISIVEVEHADLVIISVVEADRAAVAEPETVARAYEELHFVSLKTILLQRI